MADVEFLSSAGRTFAVPQELIAGKRRLTAEEIKILRRNLNHNEDSSWSNFYVDAEPGNFDPELISSSFFSGFIVLGRLKRAVVSYHDLFLETGIWRSRLENVVTGDENVIRNVAYLSNYRLGNRVILFNVQEMCCTNHSKFGNGILKQGEPESNRIWIGVANENDGRRVLPFEDMIAADAYIWSHFRDDPVLLDRFVEMTEAGNSAALDTFGQVADDVVIKNSGIIKDAKIGAHAYIKGAFKLKNITVLSSQEEPSQIGEGVIMVNGILGYGSRVFYQATAARFVIGRNCQVKYGARLLNSILGDNSTVSCCEILNNLIFPFHEQHHNSSFLIATTIMGQSNIAAGATIGSNHNSRSPDGEIFARRGFWPGLCSDFKHNSRFASFVLAAKGSYQNELDIPYPFSLVAPGQNGDQAVHIIPAWWFMYDMFAVTRNNAKFQKRDKRVVKIQQIETDPFAPDTMQEIVFAIRRIITLTSLFLDKISPEFAETVDSQEKRWQAAKDYLHQNPDADFTLYDESCQKKYGAVIFKPVKAYKMYRKVAKYFAVRTLLEFCRKSGVDALSLPLLEKIRGIPLFTEWENVGGQVMPLAKVNELFEKIRSREITEWRQVHDFYAACQEMYEDYKARYSIYLLELLYSRPIEKFGVDLFRDVISDVTFFSCEIYSASIKSREKDYTDYYRRMVYRSKVEMKAVIGTLNDNSCLHDLRKSTEEFNNGIRAIFDGLC